MTIFLTIFQELQYVGKMVKMKLVIKLNIINKTTCMILHAHIRKQIN